MKKLRGLKRAGALCLACVVLVLFSASGYLQASEESWPSVVSADSGMFFDGTMALQEQSEESDSTEGISENAGPERQESEEQGLYGQQTEFFQESGELEEQTEPCDGTTAPEEEAEYQSEIPNVGKETDFFGETAETEEWTEAPRTNMETMWQTESSGNTAGTEEQTELPERTSEPGETNTGEAEGATYPSGNGMPEDWTESEPETGAESESGAWTESESETGAENESGAWTESEPETSEETESELRTESESETGAETETELTLKDVLDEAEKQDIDFFGLAPGESLTFYVSTDQGSGIMTMAVTAVTVTRDASYRYSDYGYGTQHTSKYIVSFNDITAVAYCVQPSREAPDSGNNYTVTKLQDAKTLAKVCFYGSKSAGSEGFFAEKYPDFSEGQRFVITHMAASYANGSSDAFYGANEKGKALAMELYQYCVAQPDIPEVDMEFSDADVKAQIDEEWNAKRQRTKNIQFKADSLQSITFKLPEGVVLHNVTTGQKSAAGEAVTISGGTEFFLSAPLTQASDVGKKWTSTMKGSITKDYSAYKISTGSSTQDLALVFGDGVDDEKFIDFAVEWISPSKIKLTKKDANTGTPLEGAVYGVYSDKACKELIAKMPATDAKGVSSLELYQTTGTVYLQEIKQPKGYELDKKAHALKLVAGETAELEVKDHETDGGLTIYKEGEVLCGANVTQSGVTFLYEKRRQKGAVYNVYAAKDIVYPTGEVAYEEGTLIAENLVTGDDGSVSLSGLLPGQYKVTEMAAPANLVNTGKSKNVKVTSGSDSAEAVFATVTFVNDRQKADVSVTKTDNETKVPLEGGVYALYTASQIKDADGRVIVQPDTLIESVTTSRDGNAAFTADIPCGFSYYVKETKAPEKYVRNSEDIYSFDFRYAGEKEAKVAFSHTFENRRVSVNIKLIKVDAQTGISQGDATLENAIYGLYAREDIQHPDQKTGVLYHAGEQVATVATNQSGEASVDNLYPGNYYFREISPSKGYTLSRDEYNVNCACEGDSVAVIEKTCTVKEQVIRQPFQLIKIAGNKKSNKELLEGAGFSAYLVSSLRRGEDGAYDFASATPVVLRADGGTEIFTDENGYAVSVPLPFGTYIVRETTVPAGFAPTEDFEVRITENSPDKPLPWRVLVDDEFEVKLKIIKTDDESGRNVLKENTEFRVYDIDAGEYVEQMTHYPKEEKHTSYFTDEEGCLVLPESLSRGHYRIEEVSAPDGYTLGENALEVTVDDNMAYRMDDFSKEALIEVVASNHPVKGRLKVVKKGESLRDYDGDFLYEEKSLAGAVFEVYAAENIYTADCQRDENGERILEYADGMLVGTVITGEDGEGTLDDLPLGKYKIVEKTAPEGYVLDSAEQYVEFVYVNQDTPVVVESVEFSDDLQKAAVTVVKKNALNGGNLAGAQFGLFAKEDISQDGKTIVKADTQIATAVTGEDGKAVFDRKLPFGAYCVREIQAPEGFLKTEEVIDFTFSYEGQETDTVQLEAAFEDEPTRVEITKSDATTGVELDGASLSVMDKQGNVIDSWVSEKNNPHLITGLHIGETYVLREEFAPYGYLRAEEVEFTVSDTGEVQKVDMKDGTPVGRIAISKTGELADSITWGKMVKGTLEAIFGYVTGSLQDVVFEVYAADDIKAADGVSNDYYKKDELVATITTDASGYAVAENLPLGKYYVVEKETAEGFVLDGEPREVDLTYRDQDTPVVTYDEGWQNSRQKVVVSVLKKEKGTDLALAGGVFALCAGEEIIGKDGKVLMEADTVIEQKATGKDGKLVFSADLPVGGAYYVREVEAPAGYARTDKTERFTFSGVKTDTEQASYDFTFENLPTRVKVTKTDITSGAELPGARLQVRDKEGNIVDHWISDTSPHMIQGLETGKIYTLREESAPKGYLIAEEVKFKVRDTGKVQSVVMKDDCAQGKLLITKTDKDTGRPMKGVEFALFDSEGKLLETLVTDKKGRAESALYPIAVFENGSFEKELDYTLKETKTLKGYRLDETVHKIRFAYQDDHTPVVECELHLKNEKEEEETEKVKVKAKEDNTPKTGDSAPILPLTIMTAASACVTAVLALMRVRKKRLS